MKRIIYNSPDRLVVGPGIPVRVNLSIGAESTQYLSREEKKLQSILSQNDQPDLIMDLSVVKTSSELWKSVREMFEGPIGVLPHYLSFSEKKGLDRGLLLERIEELFENGVNFITMHCTPTLDLFSFAKQVRSTPVTSRGGGVVIRDMLMNSRSHSVFSILFDEICLLAKRYGAVINLGTSFRAASVAEGLDSVVCKEIEIQQKFVEKANAFGVQTVIEGPGHIPLNELQRYWSLIEPIGSPPMPLGPIVTDAYNGLDHIASAIGAANFMMLSQGGIINAVTAVEHQGGVPSTKHLLEGLRSAKLAAQTASLTYSEKSLRIEKGIAEARGIQETCIMDSDDPGCTRCSHLCPLVADTYTPNLCVS